MAATKQIKFEGKIHTFPKDATDDEINEILGGAPSQPKNESWLDKAGSLAEHFNNAVVGTGLPNAARGFFQAGSDVIRGPLNLIPGVNIPNPGFSEMPIKDVNPGIQRAAEFAGGLTGYIPAFAEQRGIEGLQAFKNVPEWIRGIGSGAAVGSVNSPDNRKMGAALGASFGGANHAKELSNKLGDIFPVFKKVASSPYIKQMEALKSKDLLSGYSPNKNDILEAHRLLTSPGIDIPHEAVNEAVTNAINGNFKPWFRLQSSLKSEARRLSKKGGVHNELGDKLYNLAEKMHVEMGEAQAARGAPEAEKLMKQGQKRTARYHKISTPSKVIAGVGASVALPSWAYRLLKGLG